MSSCPSCPLLDVAYGEQLTQKHKKIARALGAYPRLSDFELPEVHPSANEQGYRNRARMVVRPEANSPQTILGFYEEGSRQVVPVDQCRAHHPSIETVLDALRPLLLDYHALRGFARFVDVRSTAGHAAAEESVILTLAGELDDEKSDALAELETLAASLQHALAERVDELKISVHLNVAHHETHAVLSGEQRVVAGDAWLDVEISGTAFRVPPTAFFQVNLDQLEAAHGRMAELLGEHTERLVDLYCGVGVHGIVLADSETELFGTDIAEDAIELAQDNAKRADRKAEFFAAADTDASDWLLERVDGRSYTLLTNPARAGMSPEMAAFVGDSRPERILYLSCEPRTLARDLDRIIDQGYRLVTMEPFDFMPQTDQVETLAVLEADDAPAELSRERAYQPRDPSQRQFSPGVSGPNTVSDTMLEQTHWVALVAGKTPKHGFLPNARDLSDQGRIEVERLRNVEGNSVVRVKASTLSDDEIRQRFRAWDHPVLGDPDYGDRNANHLAARHAYLDRMALHCVEVKAGGERYRAEVPGAFLGLMRLPRKVLEG